MQYALIENGEVKKTVLPKVGVLKDGRTVSGYDLLGVATLKVEGWLPLEDDKPSCNWDTQYLEFDRYEIKADKVIRHYLAVDIVIPEVAPQIPSVEDRITAVENALLTII